MAGKAHSGNILDLGKTFRRNKFEDKTVVLDDMTIVFDGFISSKRGEEFVRLSAPGTAEAVTAAIVLVMKHPDEALARRFVEAIEEQSAFGDGEPMDQLVQLILGYGPRESDPNS